MEGNLLYRVHWFNLIQKYLQRTIQNNVPHVWALRPSQDDISLTITAPWLCFEEHRQGDLCSFTSYSVIIKNGFWILHLNPSSTISYHETSGK